MAINLLSAFLTCHDKRQARRGGRRVREQTLFLLALVGGAPLMYLTMRKIRHKTLHKRFMVGLPLIIILQIVILIWISRILIKA